MTILVWLGAVAALAIAIAPYIPSSAPVFDLPSHFVVHAAIFAALLLVVAVASRVTGKVYLVLLLSYFLCLGQLWPYLVKTAPADAGQGATLRLLQANVWTQSEATRPFRNLVRHENPDVIIVAEINPAYVRLFGEMKDDYPHQHLCIHDVKECRHGIAVLSRLPISDVTGMRKDMDALGSLSFRIEAGGKTVDMVAMHTLNPMHDGGGRRDAEFSAFADWFAKEQPARLILAGDLNATLYSHALKSLVRRTGLKSPRTGRGIMGTWPVAAQVSLLRLPIDHVLATENLHITDFRLGTDIGSDHLPTIAVIKL